MLLHQTTSLCATCKRGLDAEVVRRGDEVWMQKACPDHGPQEVRLARDAEWYVETRAIQTPDHLPPGRRAMEHGCPFDCGPCEAHTQSVKLPVVTITSACNLDCPICYVHNKNTDAFEMGDEEFDRVLDRIIADHGGDLDVVNFTGGEPTLHPQWLDFMRRSRERGVHRVSICTNGIALVNHPEVVEELAKIGGRVALSFDSFDDEVDYALQGARLIALKKRCLELLDQHGVDTTLIPVMTKGHNEQELGALVRLGLGLDCVRHIEVHTMTYTGQSGVDFDRSGRISMDEVLALVDEQLDPLLRRSDFVPSPCAHPLCYQIAYLLLDPEGGEPVPFMRFLDKQTVYECLGDHLYLEPSPRLERAFLDAIDRLWVEESEEAERTLRILKGLLRQMFPEKPLSRAAALRVSERSVKAVYLHSHMDEETFDAERVAMCCDSNCYADGTTIPVCSYNVLYRDTESRFMTQPRAWGPRQGSLEPLPRAEDLVHIREPSHA